MDSAYQLVVRKGPQPGQIYPLLPISITIGRDPITDIAINDPEVSRQHARLTKTNDSYQIEDLQSTNGTFVNGVQIGVDPVQLAHGNEIQLGSGVVLIFELAPETDDDEEVPVKTAVPPPPPEELKSDPMLPPPEYDRLGVIDDLPVTDPQFSVPDIQEELAAAPIAENPLPPLPEIPSVDMPLTPPPPPLEQNADNPARRLFTIGAVIILLLMCCCCGFLFFMYQWGGDWILQQMGLIP